MPSPLPEKTID